MHHFRGLISKLSSSASKERLKKEHYLINGREEHYLINGREEHYLINGGVLLEEFMALCDGKCRIPLRYFSAVEIERATKDAKCRLYCAGRYMVTGLLDKRFVLVNFTDSSLYRNNDMCRDIAITSQMSHLKNVLKLIGCCLEYAKPVMVYEYVEEAITLHDLLFNNDHARNSSVPWGSRLRIANDIASAIVYLHSEFNTPIIYKDLCSEKVLIDQSSGVAKLFDFSLSVSLPPGELEVEPPGGLCGRYGLLEPEYNCSGIVTQKTDVYGFGNVLLQLFTGTETCIKDGVIRNHGLTNSDTEECMTDTDIEKCNVMDIVDPAILAGESGIHDIRQQLEDCWDLVKRCTASKGEDRPYMINVAREIRRIEKCYRALSTVGLN